MLAEFCSQAYDLSIEALTIYSSRNPEARRTCSEPNKSNLMKNTLNQRHYKVVCSGRVFATGPCGTGPEICADCVGRWLSVPDDVIPITCDSNHDDKQIACSCNSGAQSAHICAATLIRLAIFRHVSTHPANPRTWPLWKKTTTTTTISTTIIIQPKMHTWMLPESQHGKL